VSPASPCLLALETSTSCADVAIVDATGIVRARRSAVAARHSANLLTLCAEALDEAGVSVSSLAGVACGAGPGSFTGLRVGMAVAKGLAMPFDLPFFAIPSLQALALGLAQQAPDAAWVVPCLDGGKGQIFGAYFRAVSGFQAPVQESETLALDAVAFVAAAPTTLASPIVAAGPGLTLLRKPPATWPVAWRDGGQATPTALAVATLAWPRLLRGERDDLATSVPSYGRLPDITTPKKSSGGPAS